MKTKIVKRDAFYVLGTMTRIVPEKDQEESFVSIWQEFESHHQTIRQSAAEPFFYGVSFNTDEEGLTDYLAGMAVSGEVRAPEGLVVRQIPAAHYAVFQCEMAKIGETYQFIFGQWLPGTSYGIDNRAPVFEQYPPEGEEASPVWIHIPIQAPE
jgi:predicted transcriptional regulator YdeE